jgi:long-chain acyl-CoA synthetase
MIWNLLDEVSADGPERLAIIDGDVSLTYGELVRRSVLLAAVLRERLDVSEGDVVAVSLPNCWQYPVAVFAVARLGAVVMPFNTQWRAAEIGWFVHRLGIKTVITGGELRSVWSEVDGGPPEARILTIDGAEMARMWDQPANASDDLFTEIAESRPVLYLTTSGSTGRPKVVPRSHANLLAGRNAVAQALGVRRGHRFLSVIPFHHANGFANCLLLPLTSGATVVIARKAHPASIAAIVKRERIEVMIGSPFLFSLLADHIAQPEDFASVAAYISSGARLPGALAVLWRERFGRGIRQIYGSSETGTISIEEADGPSVPGAAGRLLPTVTVRILDADGAQLPPGRSGEISVRSPAMMAGYVGEPELNREVFDEGFFRMGDVCTLSADGILVIEGRIKRWVNSGGVKVDPAEVERVLLSLPSVKECRVHAGRDGRGLEVLTSMIVMHSGHACSRRAIIEHCRKHLAEYKIPRVIQFLDTIPSDLLGKSPVEWLPK